MKGRRISSQKLALLICTKDRPTRVEEFVDHFLKIRIEPMLIVLIDSTSEKNGVTLNKLSLTKLRDKGWDTVHLLDKPGLPHQRNTGLDYLSKNHPEITIACFLDDDIAIAPDYFKNVEKCFDLDKDLVVVGGYDKGSLQRSKQFPKLLVKIGFLPGRHGQIAKSGLALVPKPNEILDYVDFVPGGMQSLKLEQLGRVRFSEESNFFGEDLEMHFRLATLGRIAASSLLPVLHRGATEGKHDNGDQAFHEHLVRLSLNMTDSARVPFHAVVFGGMLVMLSDTIQAVIHKDFKLLFRYFGQHLRGLFVITSMKTKLVAKSLV